MTDYLVIYEPADDGTVSAFVPSLPVYSTGVDRADAERSVREAIELHLSVLAERGSVEPPPQLTTGIVSV